MRKEILFAGHGGQGVMSMGLAFAHAVMSDGWEVTWLPSYGPEQRGGTANCMVVVSDRPIGSPMVTDADYAVIMNVPSLEKYAGAIKPGGVLLVNAAPAQATRADARTVPVPAWEIARELGDERVANMVMLGALVSLAGLVNPETVEAELVNVLPERHHHLLLTNRCALQAGARAVQPLAVSG